ncbi:hypothetical protein Tco_0784633 [Tanacetum coccineum]
MERVERGGELRRGGRIEGEAQDMRSAGGGGGSRRGVVTARKVQRRKGGRIGVARGAERGGTREEKGGVREGVPGRGRRMGGGDVSEREERWKEQGGEGVRVEENGGKGSEKEGGVVRGGGNGWGEGGCVGSKVGGGMGD